MTRDEALALLRSIRARQLDPTLRQGFAGVEGDHGEADGVLLDLIGDDGITEAFDAIEKWYA